MNKHLGRVVKFGWLPVIAGATFLAIDMDEAVANIDKNVRSILANSGWHNPPENVASYIWHHPPAAAGSLVVIFAVGAALSWGLEPLWRYLVRPTRGSSKTIPLHRAARYLAQSSGWAASLDPSKDEDWCGAVDQEIQGRLASGELPSWGVYRPPNERREAGQRPIPPDFWQRAQWESAALSMQEPPVHIWRSTDDGGGHYDSVVVDELKLRELWPPRSWLQSLLGRSPIDRIDLSARKSNWDRLRKRSFYSELWKRQDEAYPQQVKRFGMNVLELLYPNDRPR